MANKGIGKKIALMVVALALCLPLMGGYFISDMARVGTGYASKIMCSSVFVSGRDPAQVKAVDLGPTNDYPITAKVDRAQREVTATALGLFKNRAVYREGLGCTVVVDVTEEELAAQAASVPAPAPPLSPDVVWPAGEQFDPSLIPAKVNIYKIQAALDFAVPDPSGRQAGTRAVAVAYQGVLIGERYAPGFDRNTPLLGWSMSKSVTNALVGILVRQGKLDLHQPAPVPEWSDPNDPRSKITTDQLLRMSSGLKFIEEYEENITSDCNLMLFTERDLGGFAARMPLAGEPDSIWSYSSGTTNVLSRVVRHALGGTDADYYAFPRRELLDKLGMRRTVLEPDPSGTFVGSSNFYATARDWARFGLLYLNDGVWQGERILPEGWVEYCVTPTPKSNGEYGAQFWLNAGAPGDRWLPDLPEDLYSALGHDGQYVTILPSHELVIVRLGFTPNHRMHWDHQKFVKMVIEGLGK